MVHLNMAFGFILAHFTLEAKQTRYITGAFFGLTVVLPTPNSLGCFLFVSLFLRFFVSLGLLSLTLPG